MAIPPEFNYANEADFTGRFLIPLIQRLGFSLVVNYHGQRERGKDLIFAEIDRFSDITYYGLQAKYIESVGKSDALGLVEDCKEAFWHEFEHPQTRLRHRIARFYVANGGTFSEEGRANFFTGVERDYGGCVRLLDGKALLALDRYAAAGKVAFAGETLRGLLLEMNFNDHLCTLFKPAMTGYLQDSKRAIPIERMRTAAVQSYLVRPFSHKVIDTAAVDKYLYEVSNINNFLDALLGFRPAENKTAISRVVLCGISNVETLSIGLKGAVVQLLGDLQPLIPL